MFDPSSRYAGLATLALHVETPAGERRSIRYVERRIIPAGGERLASAEHRVRAGERLDHIAARYLQDARQYWRIVDGQAARTPSEMTAEPDAVIELSIRLR